MVQIYSKEKSGRWNSCRLGWLSQLLSQLTNLPSSSTLSRLPAFLQESRLDCCSLGWTLLMQILKPINYVEMAFLHNVGNQAFAAQRPWFFSQKITNKIFYTDYTVYNLYTVYTVCTVRQTWNLSNVLHKQDSQNFQFQPKKTRKSRHFWQKN